ncbi:C-type lectin 16-like [Saccoglossus kowalevskii]|uniref:Perlucin-like protein-like n=1 Tax=Saccoglossus kowalevskii TaxID=10224 RepID=A0ABM0GPJ5_SACKO|nr:PREDICTED: perlucin-like protein-like [Saccoglossus kowalevskii]
MLRYCLLVLLPFVVQASPYNVHLDSYRWNIVLGDFTWFEARDACDASGGRLAVFDQKNKNKAVRQFIMATPELKEGPGGGFWIGCHDLKCEGVFEWVNGIEVSSMWTQWYQGPPTEQPNNNPAQEGGQDCCQLWKKPQNKPVYHWDDEFCDAEKGYVCEYHHAEC